MKAFTWVDPEDVAAAVKAGAEQGALFKAGGVDVADRLKERIDEPSALVNLRHVQGLDFVRDDGSGGLRLGPLVTLATLASDARVRRNALALADAAAQAATPQIRNAATLGGNLAQRPRCWYFRREEFKCRRKGGTACFAIDGQNEQHAVFENDLCAIVHPSATATALSALGATLELEGPKGKREVAIDEFFVLPSKSVLHENVLMQGELIVAVRIPPGRKKSGYVKLMEKQSFDWPLAEAAVCWTHEGKTLKNPRVTLGAAAPVPWRAGKAEALLSGKTLDAELAVAAARAAVQGAKPLEQNGAKVALLEMAVKRALLAAGGLS